MISKNKIKYIRLLEKKKFRNEYGCFVAEGNKLVADMLHSFDCEFILAKVSWMATQGDLAVKELVEAEENDLQKVSFQKTPQDVLAIFKLPDYRLEEVNPNEELVLALDGIQDPGNLGTIIRLADWYGISHIVCSMDTVDTFSPKTVQVTMGALTKVKVHYTLLEEWLQQQKAVGVPLYGTFLNGEDMYKKPLTATGILVMGNEGNGIRPEIGELISDKLYIPDYPAGHASSESLNVGVATAIICAEFRRRQR